MGISGQTGEGSQKITFLFQGGGMHSLQNYSFIAEYNCVVDIKIIQHYLYLYYSLGPIKLIIINYYQFPSRNAMLKVYEKLKKRYIIQVILHSCALAECGGPQRLTFALGRLKNLTFSQKSYAGHPRFYSIRALGSFQFSLEHSLFLVT